VMLFVHQGLRVRSLTYLSFARYLGAEAGTLPKRW
jgi:hypothetical protein